MERRAILARCGKAGCPECLPSRRLHWFKQAAGYTMRFVDNLHHSTFPSNFRVDTIRARVSRAGGMACIIETTAGLVCLSTVPLAESTKVTGAMHLLDIIDQAVVTIGELANRPVKASYDMRPEPEEKPETEWETVTSAPGSMFYAFRDAAREMGLKEIKGRARGRAVIASATFKLKPEYDYQQQAAVTEWLFMGQRPPPNNPFRRPTATEKLDAGEVVPKHRRAPT